jgi:hypothetical protein
VYVFQVVRAGHALRDVPAAGDDVLVGGEVVAYQAKDHRYDVFGDALMVLENLTSAR